MIYVLFGKPRCGKSTTLASVSRRNHVKREKYLERTGKSRIYKYLHSKEDSKICNKLEDMLYPKNFYDVIYSTDPSILYTVPIEYSQIGRFRPTPNSLYLLEEAGIGINNREYKGLSKESKRFAAMHGHMLVDVLIVSQSVDIDKSYRQRADTMFIASKRGPFTSLRRISFSVDVDETTHDLVDAYWKCHWLVFLIELIASSGHKYRNSKLPFTRSRLILRRRWYPYFNSYIDDYEYPEEDPAIEYYKNLTEKQYSEEVVEELNRISKEVEESYEVLDEELNNSTEEEFDFDDYISNL